MIEWTVSPFRKRWPHRGQTRKVSAGGSFRAGLVLVRGRRPSDNKNNTRATKAKRRINHSMMPNYHEPSTLYMIASPIGNLMDLTLRALEVLKSCDIVACEDTRKTGLLLKQYGLSKRLLSCRAANEAASAQGLIKLLSQGKMLAYLSDAGTPGLSDPGSRLVSAVLEAGFRVLPLPGPSALACLWSVNPFGSRSFLFDGFLPVKSGPRRRRLAELLDRGECFLFYEAPHRVQAVLTEIAELAPRRPLLVGREMTKIHEEYLRGTAEEILQKLKSSDTIRGEFVFLVSELSWEKW